MSNDNLAVQPLPEPENDGVQRAKAALKPFLDIHPYSGVELVEGGPNGSEVVVTHPWNDASITFLVPADPEPFFQALNRLRLPEKFTAIWHRETKALEVIWTAYTLTGDQAEIYGRKFTLRYDGAEYECEFGDSSDELMAIAASARPTGISETQFRNLFPFNLVTKRKARGFDSERLNQEGLDKPISFWIRAGFEWNENKVIELVNVINFYMTYYDTRSPHVMLHYTDESVINPQTRYVEGYFPTNISSRSIDQNLLHFWNAARTGDEAKRFLQYYRLLEYAVHFYIDGNARTEVRKLLSAPNALDKINDLTEKMISALQKSNFDHNVKLSHTINQCVSPHKIWHEIQVNRDHFMSEILFDGGFLLKKLITPGMNGETFATSGMSNFINSLKDIRNALAHGRETKQVTFIAPTVDNFAKLRPWIPLIAITAAEVMLYKDY